MHDQHELIPGDHTIFVPLQALTKTLDAEQASDTSNKLPGNFQICNSPLSEEGALAFEYGYSTQRFEEFRCTITIILIVPRR